MTVLHKMSFNDVVEHLFTLFDKTDTAAAVAGSDHTILSCNRTFTDMYKGTGKCSGMKLRTLFKKDLKYKYPEMCKSLNETGFWNTKIITAKNKKENYLSISFSELMRINKKSSHILVIIWNYTDYKKREVMLQSLKENLEKENREQKASISALKDVIVQIELEKREMQHNVKENISKNIIPIIKNLKSLCRKERNITSYIETIERRLADITAGSGEHVINDYEKLSPRETEICSMIKKNLSNKEIADLINISILTVERHRHNIRKKLGLLKRKMNLHSYLSQE